MEVDMDGLGCGGKKPRKKGNKKKPKQENTQPKWKNNTKQKKPNEMKNIPQGLTETQFKNLSEAVTQKAKTMGLEGDIVVHGSRATDTARPNSDIDIAIRLPKDKFDNFLKQRFKTPNPGTAKEKTMLHAIKTGKIQAGETGLSQLRRHLESELGMEVDVSVVLKDGPFDKGPVIPLW